MRNWIFLVALSLSVVACNNDTPTVEDINLPQPPNREVAAPAALSSVFAPPSGVLRGVDFSMDRAAIANAENAAQVESSESSLMYTLDINESEFVDVIYSFEGDQLKEIEMDIYANDIASVESYYSHLVDFFDSKYLSREELWDGSANNVPFTAFVQKVDDPENPGIIIFYEKMNESSAAVFGE